VYHENALGLYFYNARWYDPLLGRFTQADTLIPSPGDPRAFNRYAYTLNNPLRFTDPSGHWIVDDPDGGGWTPPGGGSGGGGGGHSGGGGGGGGKGKKSHYYCNNHYGCIDMSHFHPDKVRKLLRDVNIAILFGGGQVTLNTSFMRNSTYFEATYFVSGETSEGELVAVALAIWLDYQHRYETFQGKMYWHVPGPATSFAPEDLPTDYLAFVSAVKDMSFEEISFQLGGMQGRKRKPFDYYLFQNYSHQPLIIEHDRFGLPVRAKHASWPESLTIEPISSESGLWRFENSNSHENLSAYVDFLLNRWR